MRGTKFVHLRKTPSSFASPPSWRFDLFESVFEILAAVKNAFDQDRFTFDKEGYRDATFEADDPESGKQIVPLLTAFGKDRKTETVGDDAFDIVVGRSLARSYREPCVQRANLPFGQRCKENPHCELVRRRGDGAL